MFDKRVLLSIIGAFIGLLILAASDIGTQGTEVNDLTKVVVYHAVIDSNGSETDTDISYITIKKSDLKVFIAEKIRLDQEPTEETPAHWNFVNRQLVRIYAAKVTLEVNPQANVAEIQHGELLKVWDYKTP